MVRTSNGREYHQDVRKLALLKAAGEMSTTVTSKGCLTNDKLSTSNINPQGTQDTQGTQDAHSMQETPTQLRRPKRLNEK
jgi:hypothetical protein